MQPRQYVVLGALAAASLIGLAVYNVGIKEEGPQTGTGMAAMAGASLTAAPVASAPEWTPTAVEVDGTLIGYAADETVVQAALKAAQEAIPAEALAYVDLGAKVVTWTANLESQPELLDAAQIQEALVKLAPELVNAWVISVNGQEVVAVASQPEAEQAIEEIQNEYKETVLKEAATIEQLHILESIDFVPKRVVAEEIRTKDEAKEILRYGTDKRIFYTVQRGDTLWDIAVQRGLTVEELVSANPGIDPELLQPGQQLSMTVNEPYVHLESTEVQVYTARIPFPEEVVEDPELWPWQVKVIKPGQYGKKEVTVRIHRQNGQEVGREVVQTRILKDPVKQVRVQGARMAPKLGTGQFYWPVKGTITDRFGWTGSRYHTGLDIAAPTGTPVYAADSGTVVYAGRRGRYGLLLEIDHGEGKVVTWYGHLSGFAVKLGDQVERGQVIGYVGNTGYSTGPHLHFEVRIDGRWENPLKFYP